MSTRKTKAKSVVSCPHTFEGLIRLWIQERSPVSASVVNMEGIIRSFEQHTGCRALSDLERSHLLQWKKAILDDNKCSPVTWNTYLRHFRVLIHLAEQWGWSSNGMLRGIRTVATPQPKKRTIDDLSVTRIKEFLLAKKQFKVLPGWFWWSVVKTFYYTGMRRRQLVGLRWADIDMGSRTIHLVGEHSKTKRDWDIPLSENLIPELEDLKRQTAEVLGRRVTQEDQVFNVTLFNGRYVGATMTVGHVTSALRRIGDHTGIEVSSHRFRHTFASKLASTGTLKELQTMLGHTSLKTTMEYVRPDVSKMQSMVGGLNNV